MTAYQNVRKPRHPQIVVTFKPSIKHHSDDDILGTMGNALRQGQCSQDEINEFYIDARRGTRANLISTCKRWATIKGA